jgi:pimeloyl-ACP methyl ester carboxylesterase
MIAVTAAYPDEPSRHPPIILVHGAANSAAVWIYWQRTLASAGWASYAIDLRGHGHGDAVDLSVTSMADYATDVRSLVSELAGKPIVIGWSMGGLISLMVAAQGGVHACVALAPSAPARTRDPAAELRAGIFGPEEYGLIRNGAVNERALPDLDAEEQAIAVASLCSDSRYARDDRQAGIIIERLECPLLIVTGAADRQWPRARYDGLWLKADYLSAEQASHWGLVLNRRALGTFVPRVLEWLGSQAN